MADDRRVIDHADREAYQRLLREASRYLGRPEDHGEVVAAAELALETWRRLRRERVWAE
jgi:hypothetical protein